MGTRKRLTISITTRRGPSAPWIKSISTGLSEPGFVGLKDLRIFTGIGSRGNGNYTGAYAPVHRDKVYLLGSGQAGVGGFVMSDTPILADTGTKVFYDDEYYSPGNTRCLHTYAVSP